MKKITLKKVTRDQLEILQREMQLFSINIRYNDLQHNFLDAIILMDIINAMYFTLRNKIESHRMLFNLNLPINQAGVILKCCLRHENKDDYAKAFFEQLKTTIDQQLKSII
jgi:hypothetical protein